jgi:hypothetical protein
MEITPTTLVGAVALLEFYINLQTQKFSRVPQTPRP